MGDRQQEEVILFCFYRGTAAFIFKITYRVICCFCLNVLEKGHIHNNRHSSQIL